MFKIGLFTSARGPVSLKLIREVYQNIQTGKIPNSEITFVFVSKEEGETHFGDLMINNVRSFGLPLITFPSFYFRPELRKKDREVWRKIHDREIMKLLPQTDLDVLLGYMWVFGEGVCQKRKMINLHPALPRGPKGTYPEVIWQLIKNRANESGVMMHLVTEDLDAGPVIAFCRFPIKGSFYDPLWQEMEKRLESESLEQIMKKKGEENVLFQAIRKEGVKREFPFITQTIKLLAEGKVKINNTRVKTDEGEILENGYDLTSEIENTIKI